MVFGDSDTMSVPEDFAQLCNLFESIEKGSTEQLTQFMNEAEYKYKTGMEKYWQKKIFAPSCLIFYLGLNKKIKNLNHHTLFFDEDLEQHSREIYKEKQWPSKPLFYVCCPSKTDNEVAPMGSVNLFLLMPVAAGLADTDTMREKYFDIMINRLEKQTGENLLSYIEYKKSYCINDFIIDYNSYKGNAYGLANTLLQTANSKNESPGL